MAIPFSLTLGLSNVFTICSILEQRELWQARPDHLRSRCPSCVGWLRPTLPFGVKEIDEVLPGGGLALGAVHEFSEEGPRGGYAVCALLFAAGILARLPGPILWCLHSRDLFAPALARVGLHPARIIF